MIEVPIDFVTPGDILGKYHTFRRYEMGMSSSVDLEKGYRVTARVIQKLRTEYRASSLFIEDPSPDMKDVSYVEPYDEAERQKGISTIVRSMNRMRTSKLLDLRVFGPVVEDILNNVYNILKNGKGSFKSLSTTFLQVQSHDLYTWEHSVNTAIYAAIIALRSPRTFDTTGAAYSVGRTSRVETLVFNLLLHDIGKIKIPEEILNKSERLTPDQVELVRKHPENGVAYIRQVNRELEKAGMPWIPSYYMQACLSHHQAWDGSGYPRIKAAGGESRTLRGKEIPVVGRIAAVADIYDAVSSSRPFRSPFHPRDAIEILQMEKGRKLDPDLVDAFVGVLYPYPIGGTVVLSTRELAVITGYNNENKLEPVVRPIMKKARRDGREVVVRLPWTQQQSLAVTPDSKVTIEINKEIYQPRDQYYQ